MKNMNNINVFTVFSLNKCSLKENKRPNGIKEYQRFFIDGLIFKSQYH